MVFDGYASYYDAIYGEKDYPGEAAFVLALASKHGVAGGSLLDLGCGTGRHCLAISEQGWAVTGVDRSESMLKFADGARGDRRSLVFRGGDVRSVRLEQTFDLVVSLFHVMSYQVSNDDLLATFRTANAHLAKGGLFIFDFWYGPGVLTDPPGDRTKRVDLNSGEITRVTTAALDSQRNRVDVHFSLTARRDGEPDERLEETHQMRYLFAPEVELLAGLGGFEVLQSCEWMTGEQLTTNSWNACVVCKKVGEAVRWNR